MILPLTQMQEASRAVASPLFAGLPGDCEISFEFFPPKTEKMEEQLWDSVVALSPLGPRFVSVTYGAGGTTRERTHNTVARIARDTPIPAAAPSEGSGMTGRAGLCRRCNGGGPPGAATPGENFSR